MLGKSARDLLDEAFAHGAHRYSWLFGRENNYAWYRPRENAIVDVLYALAPEPLGKLDADVLGSLYATYAQDIDRDRLGQFFTPRDVVRFMLDRVGFSGPDSVFRIEGDSRKPRLIFDFATGSGGFLVEAARRIIDAVGAEQGDPGSLQEALEAIVRGLSGGEISPFPYYLTEINLLLQVSRVLGPLHASQHEPPPFGALGVLPIDTLTTKRSFDQSLEIEPELRADRAEAVADERFGLVPLDGDKRQIYRNRLRPDGVFDLVIGNPPYIAEANNKPLFDRLRAIPAWRGIYRGKTDYLYYFLWLAVEKLAPGGRLCVITPAGWMNAGAADFLRQKLATELTLEKLFLFGDYRLFATINAAPTPTVESAILVATKRPAPKGHKLRVVVLESGEAWADRRHELLEEMARRVDRPGGRRGGIHVHNVLQAALRPEYPWPVKFGAKDVATRAVELLQARLDSDELEPLERSWKVFQGIQTGADAYTRRIDKRLSSGDRAALAQSGLHLGDPVLELPPGREREEPWASHDGFLVRSPEPRALLYGAVDDRDFTNLVVIRDHPPERVLRAIEPWRPLLATRAEIARNSRRRWWEATWPRNRGDMAAPKVIALYRTDRGRFALDASGDWQPSIKSTLVVGRERDAPVAYLCGLLNSELLDLWYAVRGKTPWHVRRNYEPLRMNEMPYRPPNGDPRADRVGALVHEMAENRRQLLPHRDVFRGLARVVKDPWSTGPVELDEAALVRELPVAETVSVRLDPGIELEVSGTGRARVERVALNALELRRGRSRLGSVRGDPARLDLLARELSGRADDRIGEVLLPKDLSRFAALAAERRRRVDELLTEGRRLVEEVERLVCALYEVPDGLTEDVVAHAVQRAATAPSDD
jgi:N-6 DNA Methylase/Eco57I restriction-modification methylase